MRTVQNLESTTVSASSNISAGGCFMGTLADPDFKLVSPTGSWTFPVTPSPRNFYVFNPTGGNTGSVDLTAFCHGQEIMILNASQTVAVCLSGAVSSSTTGFAGVYDFAPATQAAGVLGTISNPTNLARFKPSTYAKGICADTGWGVNATVLFYESGSSLV